MRYICIHGHFYQPPRENPWLETVETQDSAHPYHDWNARITAECYAPNTAAQVLNDHGLIARLVNNFSYISFNVGPTLLSWLETQAPEVYQGILEADRLSRERFGGHGSAMAQAYNHLIMPLANRRDKATQVVWGLRDFEHRFGRPAEGMWLPETAVDIETLEVLAAHGVQFTVLAPHQAARTRPLAGGAWQDVTGARIDPKQAYLQRLPSGRSINVFFYDGPVSKAIAFDELLASGRHLTHRLTSAFDPASATPQLVHVATDGETYGHHHRFGDMALAHAIELVEDTPDVRLTNYGEFLALHPPAWEVDILEATAWSCAHGVERWRSDCGCSTGGNPGWRQRWRAPLRNALDWLRDDLSLLFERAGSGLLAHPWEARDASIDLILERSAPSRERFLARFGKPGLDATAEVACLTLLEMQRQAQLMYTSCGWFFDDIGGIEASQVLLYAARAIELAQAIDGLDRSSTFCHLLESAEGNTPAAPNGRTVYMAGSAAGRVDFDRAAAHFALLTLTGLSPTPLARLQFSALETHAARHRGDTLARGTVEITDNITGAVAVRSYLAVRSYAQQPQCWVNSATPPYTSALQAFNAGGAAAVEGVINQQARGPAHRLEAMLTDDRRRLLVHELDGTLRKAALTLQQHYPGYRIEPADGEQVRPAFRSVIQAVLHYELRETLAGSPAPDRVGALLAAAADWDVAVDREALGYVLTNTLNRLSRQLDGGLGDEERMAAIIAALECASLGDTRLWPNLWLVTLTLTGGIMRNASASSTTLVPLTKTSTATTLKLHQLQELLRISPGSR